MKRWFSALSLVAALLVSTAAMAGDFTLGSLSIDHPWARASVAANGAAFMTISTSGSTPDQLVAAASPVAEKVELHTHIMDGNVMQMRPVQAVDVSAGAPAELKPGGFHVMLIGLKGPLKEGERFPLTLTFAKAGSVTVDVLVEAPGAGAVEHMGGHMGDHMGQPMGQPAR